MPACTALPTPSSSPWGARRGWGSSMSDTSAPLCTMSRIFTRLRSPSHRVRVAAEEPEDLPSVVRRRVRDAMVARHILERMVRDIRCLLLPQEETDEGRGGLPLGRAAGNGCNRQELCRRGGGWTIVVITMTDCPPRLRGGFVKMAAGGQCRRLRWQCERPGAGRHLGQGMPESEYRAGDHGVLRQ